MCGEAAKRKIIKQIMIEKKTFIATNNIRIYSIKKRKSYDSIRIL